MLLDLNFNAWFDLSILWNLGLKWLLFFHEWQISKSRRSRHIPTPRRGVSFCVRPSDWSNLKLPPTQLLSCLSTKFSGGGQRVLFQKRSHINKDILFWDIALLMTFKVIYYRNMCPVTEKIEFHTFFAGFMKILLTFAWKLNCGSYKPSLLIDFLWVITSDGWIFLQGK